MDELIAHTGNIEKTQLKMRQTVSSGLEDLSKMLTAAKQSITKGNLFGINGVAVLP